MFVGIDLGTTFSAIAALDERGRAVTLPNRDGEMLTPSAVLFTDDGAVVGQSALDVALEQPERVATLIKRRMGLPDFGRPVAGRSFRPEARRAYLEALFRARTARADEGIRRVADAFAQLGDGEMSARALQMVQDSTVRKVAR